MKDQTIQVTRTAIRTWITVWILWLLVFVGNIFHPTSTLLVSWLAWSLFWFGALLTIPVFMLLYQARSATISKFNPAWLTRLCIAAWCLYIILLGSAVFIVPRHIIMTMLITSARVVTLLVLPALAVEFLGLSKQRAENARTRTVNRPVTQFVASLVLLALIVSTYCAVHSFRIPPSTHKFVYNDLANAAGFASLGLIAFLSYLQRGIYSLSRSRTLKLDERQLQERQEVFEISYKLAVGIVFAAVFTLYSHKTYLQAIINRNNVLSGATPGAIFWPLLNLAFTLFSLPLLVASYMPRRDGH